MRAEGTFARSLRYLMVLSAGTATMAVRPAAARAMQERAADSTSYQLEIPAQPLPQALAALRAATGWQVDAEAGSIDGVTSRPVVGRFTVERALRMMVAGTQIAVKIVGPGHATLHHTAVQLEEMSVTAARRRDRVATASSGLKTDALLVETPQSISVITSDLMEVQNARTLQDALRYSAGVRAETYGLDNRSDGFTLRGGSQGSTVLDGLRLPLSGYYGSVRNEPYAFDQIEVLRGPASVLYGQNSPGGLINLVSKLPQATTRGEVGVQLGNRQFKEITADFTGSFDAGHTVLYRFVGLLKDTDTQVQYAGEEREFVAPSLTWLPDRATTITAYGQYQRDRSGNNVGFFPWVGTLLPAPNGRIPDDVFIGEPSWDGYGGERIRGGYQIVRQLGGGWRLRHDFRYDRVDGHLDGMYANYWEGLLPDGRSINRSWYASHTNTKIANGDLALTGNLTLGPSRHDFLVAADALWVRETNPFVGGDATPLDLYAPVYGTFALPPIDFGPDIPTHNRQLGATVQDQVKLGEHLVVTGSLRYDRARVEVEDTPEAGADVGAWSHRLGVVYRTAGGLAPYASYSTSFEVVTGTDNHGTPFKPLRGKQWEAGVKWMPERSRVSVTAAGYVLKEKNRLTTDPADPTNVLQRGEATIKGAELEVTTALPWLDLLGSYTYTNAKLTASSDPADPYLNKRLSSIPEHAASLWATHAVHAGRLHGLRFGAGVRYQGTTWDGQDLLATPSNTLVDAVLSFELGHWRYALNATNLFDKIYFGTCLDRGDCWYGSRRSVAVRAMYRY